MRRISAGAAALLLALLSAHPVAAAVRYTTVTPEVAAPGDTVTVEIHDRGGMFFGEDLYLIPTESFADDFSCDRMAGAVWVGSIAWTHSGTDHDAVVAFTLPLVPDGTYAFGEALPGVLPPCAPAGSLRVSAARTPDDAMRPTTSSAAPTTAGVILILVSALLAWRRPGS